MHWPQITMIILMAMGLGISLANHGKPRSNENAVITIIANVISLGLLYMGGFFS